MNNQDLLNVINECGKRVREGIIIDDVKMPFTLIDYYTLLYKNNMESVSYANTHSFATNLRMKSVYNANVSRFVDFLDKNFLVGEFVNNPEEIMKKNYRFIFNDKAYVPSFNDISMILNIFDMLNIPRYERLIYQALHRVARDFPVFPLMLEEDEKKLGR